MVRREWGGKPWARQVAGHSQRHQDATFTPPSREVIVVTGGRTGLERVEVPAATWVRWTNGTRFTLEDNEDRVLGSEDVPQLCLVLRGVDVERKLAEKVLGVLRADGRGVVVSKQ